MANSCQPFSSSNTKSDVHKPAKTLVLSLPKHRGSALLPLPKIPPAGEFPLQKNCGFPMSDLVSSPIRCVQTTFDIEEWEKVEEWEKDDKEVLAWGDLSGLCSADFR